MSQPESRISVSVPAKVHLIGEHAVVYGKPALLTSVGLHTNLTLSIDKQIVIPEHNQIFDIDQILNNTHKAQKLWEQGDQRNDFSDLFQFTSELPLGFKQLACGTVLDCLDINSGFKLEENLEVPQGAGLGSSAAFSVAITQGISLLNDIQLTKDQVNEIAYEIEKLAHGRPSGADNSTCCYEGLIRYQKTGDEIDIKKLETQIKEPDNFFLVYTGEPELTTGELVNKVAQLPNEVREPKINRIGEMVDPFLTALTTNDQNSIISIMNETQDILDQLGVSTPVLNQLNQKIKSLKGASKLCGAGGGGIALCYFPEKLSKEKCLELIGIEPLIFL